MRGGSDIIKTMDITNVIIVLGVILFSMTLHEAMHAFMGYFLGDDTARQEGRLTLNLIKHIDPFMTILLPVVLLMVGGPVFGGAKPVPFNPNRVKYGEFGAALVAIAGPMMNLLIAFIAFGMAVVGGFVDADGTGVIMSSAIGNVLLLTISVNLGFFVFNMLPIPPLDGSRLLYSVAPESVRRIMEKIEQFGVLFVFVMIMLFSSAISKIMSACISAILHVFMTIFSV